MADKSVRRNLGIIGIMVLGLIVWHFQSDKYHVSTQYQHPDHGFTILHPGSWEIVADDKIEQSEHVAVAILAPDQGGLFRPSVIVYAIEVDTPKAANEELVTDFLQELVDAGTPPKQLEQSPFHLSGRSAMRAEYRVASATPDMSYFLQHMTILVPVDTRLYAVMCTGTALDYHHFEDIFEKMVASFTLPS